MLKVIVKTINVVTAVYVMYLVGGTVYAMGKEAGKKEAASDTVQAGTSAETNDVNYRFVDGVLYKRVGVD